MPGRATTAAIVFVALGLNSLARVDAAKTFVDGMHSLSLSDQVVLGSFEKEVSPGVFMGDAQGWTSNDEFSSGGANDFFFTGDLGLANRSGLVDANSDGKVEPFLELILAQSMVDGAPAQFQAGTLPGQHDVLQFDIRFDSIRNAATNDTTIRGDVFFSDGSGFENSVWFTNDGSRMVVGEPDDTLDFSLDGLAAIRYHTITIQLQPGDDEFGKTHDAIRISPIFSNNLNAEDTLFTIDNVILARSNSIQPFPEPVNPSTVFGDVNNDQVVDVLDDALMHSYLNLLTPSAVERQNDLIAMGNDQLDVLEALNLAEFDLNGDDFFDDADHVMLNTVLNGDLDSDGSKDGYDFLFWQRHEGSPLALSSWQTNYGSPLSAIAEVNPIPEPATLLLLGLPAVAFSAVRRDPRETR